MWSIDCVGPTESTDKSIDLLAKGISHNFNNLLAAILASAENALAACADGLPIEEELQRIRLASIRGAELVQMLEISVETKLLFLSRSISPASSTRSCRYFIHLPQTTTG